MDHEKGKQIFEALYQDVNGRALSLEGRESMGLKSKSYVYGEVLFDSFVQILKDANPAPGGVFVDAGSGTGRPTFIGHLMFDFKRSVGIELVDPLYNASAKVLKRYEKEFLPKIKDEIGDRKIMFYHGSFLDADFSDVELCWLPSTCYEEDLMDAVEVNLRHMKPNTQVLSLSKTLRSNYFQVEKQQMYDFSWGQATVFFQRKIK